MRGPRALLVHPVLAWRVVAAAVAIAWTIAPAYRTAIAAVATAIAPAQTRPTWTQAGDIQGALLWTPAYQIALTIALVLICRVRGTARLLFVFVSLAVSHVVLLALAGELAGRWSLAVHPLVYRAWAVAFPVVLVGFAARGTSGSRASGYRAFWDETGASFPDLGGAASTALYAADERELLERWLGDVAGRRVLKTDLWDEAKNTRILQWLDSRGARACGIDLAAPTAAAAVNGFGPGRLLAAVADVRRLPFRDGAFDALYSMGTVEHFAETTQAIGEIHRVLRPGGRAIVGVPNRHDPFLRPLLVALLYRGGLYGYGYERSYSRRQLRSMLEDAGFDIVAESGILFIPGWLRMLDLAVHAYCPSLEVAVAPSVRLFAWIGRRYPGVKRHGYLLATVVERREGT